MTSRASRSRILTPVVLLALLTGFIAPYVSAQRALAASPPPAHHVSAPVSSPVPRATHVRPIVTTHAPHFPAVQARASHADPAYAVPKAVTVRQRNTQVTHPDTTGNRVPVHAPASPRVDLSDTARAIYAIEHPLGEPSGPARRAVRHATRRTGTEHPSSFHRDATISASAAGWQLIAIPTNPTAQYTAESLVAEINSQNGAGTVSALAIYRNGEFTPYVYGYTSDVSLSPGQGIEVLATKAFTWTPSGSVMSSPLSIPLQLGWNLLAAPYPTGYNAASVAKQIGDEGGNATQVTEYVGSTPTTYITASKTTNFTINPGQGFWVLISKVPTSSGTWAQGYPSGTGCSTLSGNLSGTLLAGCSPYHVTDTILVPNGATLTIPGGTSLNFDRYASLHVSSQYGASAGTLKVQGTAALPVIFTSASATPAPGDWRGIMFDGYGGASHGSIAYATISYAGYPTSDTNGGGTYTGGIVVNGTDSAAPQSITNTTVRDSSSDGIEVTNGGYPTLTADTLTYDITGTPSTSPAVEYGVPPQNLAMVTGLGGTGYAPQAIQIDGGTTAGPTTNDIWATGGSTGTGLPLTVTGDVSVADNTTLTIGNCPKTQTTACSPTQINNISSHILVGHGSTLNITGAVAMKWQSGGIVTQSGYGGTAGTLNVQGTSANPVTMTSAHASPAPSDWSGIFYGGYGGASHGSIAYLTIQDAGANSSDPNGGGTFNAGIVLNGVDSANPISITHTTVQDSSAYGIDIYGTNAAPVLQNDTFTYSYTAQASTSAAVRYESTPGPQVTGTTTDWSSLSSTGFGINGISIAAGTYTGNPADGYGAKDPTKDITWPNPGIPLFPDGTIDVDHGSTLNVGPGVTVKWSTGSLHVLSQYGGLAGDLNILGTSAQPIIFTSAKSAPAPGDWGGIMFDGYGGSAHGSMAYATISYAGAAMGDTYGGGSYVGGIVVDGSDSAAPQSITNTTVRDSAGDGMLMTGTAFPTLTNDTLSYDLTSPASTSPAIEYATPPSDLSMVTRSKGTGYAPQAIQIDGGTTAGPNTTGTWATGGSTGTGLPFALSGAVTTADNTTLTIGNCPKTQTTTCSPATKLSPIDGLMTIGHGATLNITGAVAMKWQSGGIVTLPGYGGASGTLNVLGTSANPVTMTSAHASPAPGDWSGIFYSGYGGPSHGSIANLTIQDAGANSSDPYGGTYNASIVIDGTDPATPQSITNTTVQDSLNDGIEVVDNPASALPTVQHVTFKYTYALAANSGAALRYDDTPGPQQSSTGAALISQLSSTGFGINGISIAAGTYTGNPIDGYGAKDPTKDITWPNTGLPYVFDGAIQVDHDSTLNIGPGTTLEWKSGDLVVTSQYGGTAGDLNILGSAAKHVTLTSAAATPQPGDWAGVFFAGYGGASHGTIQYADISYGGANSSDPYGGGTYNADLLVNGTDSASQQIINHTTFSNSAGNDVQVTGGGQPNLEYNTFNPVPSGWDSGSNRPDFYGVMSDGDPATQSVDASNGWWGSVQGPGNYAGGPNPFVSWGTETICTVIWDGSQTCSTFFRVNVETEQWIGEAISMSEAASTAGDVPDGSANTNVITVANGISTLNGGFSLSATDLKEQSRISPDMVRSYSSDAAQSAGEPEGPLGYGWTFPFGATASGQSDNTLLVTFGSGRSDRFTPQYDSNNQFTGQWKADPGQFDTLTGALTGPWTVTDKQGNVYQFGSNGYLQSMTDRNGNVETVTWTSTSQGQQISTVSSGTRTLTFTYNSGGEISQVTDAAGRTVKYGYDGAGNLSSVTDATGAVTLYQYDGMHRLVAAIDPDHSSGVSGTWSCSSTVICSVQNQYDGSGEVTQQTDALGKITTFNYAFANPAGGTPGRQTIVTYPNVTTAYQKAGQPQAIYTYAGSFIADVQVSPDGPTIYHTQYQYDSNGDITKKIDADGNVTTYTYDNNGNKLSETDALGTTTWGPPVQNPGSEPNLKPFTTWNQAQQQVDPMGHTILYGYDSHGNLRDVTDPCGTAGTTFVPSLPAAPYCGSDTASSHSGHDTIYDMDNHGDRISVTDQKGNITTYAYDSDGNQIAMRDAVLNVAPNLCYPDPTQNPSCTPTTQWAYDAAGNVTSVTDANGNVTRNTYDADGRLIETVTYANGASGAADQNVVTKAYDADGNLVAVRDANTNAKSGICYPTPGSSCAATISYSYDADGHLISATDALGNITSYTYDDNGNLVQTTFPGGGSLLTYHNLENKLSKQVDQLGNVRTFTYDGDGNAVTTTNGNGQQIQKTYDAEGNVTSITYPTGANVSCTINGTAQTVNICTTYNAGGIRTRMQDASGTTTYQYDADDHVTQVTSPAGTITYGYDNDGHRTSMGMTRTGSTTTESESIAYDPDEREGTLTDWHGTTVRYQYDPAARMIGKTYANGISVTYGYDHDNRITDMKYTKSGTTTAEYAYTYDHNGNRTAMNDSTGGNNSYQYDALNRLTLAQTSTGTATYTYDALGNRTSVTQGGSTTCYQYNSANELTGSGPGTAPCTSFTPSTTYTYDADGNRTSVTGTNGASVSCTVGSATQTVTSCYTYDAIDELTGFAGSGTTATYTYNGDGFRATTALNGTTPTTTWLYDTAVPNPVVVQSINDSNNSATSYLYDDRGLIAQESGTSGFQPVMVDAQGTARLVTDSTGTVIGHLAFDPWGGSVASGTSGTTSSIGYTGQITDNESGLVYLRSRAYDPTTGTFLQRDDNPVDPSNPAGYNRYIYAADNPVLNVDPSGQDIGSILGGIVKGAVVVAAAGAGAVGGFVVGGPVGAVVGGVAAGGAVYGLIKASDSAQNDPAAHAGENTSSGSPAVTVAAAPSSTNPTAMVNLSSANPASAGPDTVINAGAHNVINAGAHNVINAGAHNVINAGAHNAQGPVPASLPAVGGQLVIAPGASNQPSGVVASPSAQVVAAGAGNVIAAGAGNVIAAGAGNVIAAGAGNVINAGAHN